MVKKTEFKNLFSASAKKAREFTAKKPFISCLSIGLFMTLLIYFLNACSFLGGVENILSRFGYFLFNLLIITAFYTLSLFFKRRVFVMTLVSAVWIALGVTNCVLINISDNPLEAIDFQIVRTGLAIIPIYLSIFEIILYSFLTLLIIGALVLLFVKCPKIQPVYSYALLILICCLLMLLIVGFAVIKPDGNKDEMTADNIGYPYFFLCSIFDRGIDRPDGYSEEKVEEILKDLSKYPTSAPSELPNVIFVQLESFFDPRSLKDVEFSKNPIPNFAALANDNGSGTFGVKSIGAGTANTEFEVLSGLDLEFFGVGEYPYTSVLGNNCCETIAYDLSKHGYTCHAFHNHTATFYDRYKVYSHLGFDSFTAVEHMKNVEYNEIGWERDRILTDYIFKALNSTSTPDFVFAVSVQPHGKYPDIPVLENPEITVSGIDEERRYSLEFYVNQIYETDLFIGELYRAVMDFDEKTVLVMYGDHLPSLEFTDDELTDRSTYDTDYVIVSNFGLKTEDKNINAYELFPLVLNAVDIENGFINRVHSIYKENKNFDEILRLMGYDMLYGKQIAYGDNYPFAPTEMKLGIDEISVSSIVEIEDGFYVYGSNFTPFSTIFIENRRTDTLFIDENTLLAEKEKLKYGDEISVIQISEDLRKLSQSESYTYTRGFLD